MVRIHIKAKSKDDLRCFQVGLMTLYHLKEKRSPMLINQEADAVYTVQRKDHGKALIIKTMDGQVITLPTMPWKEAQMNDNVKIFFGSHYDIYTD